MLSSVQKTTDIGSGISPIGSSVRVADLAYRGTRSLSSAMPVTVIDGNVGASSALAVYAASGWTQASKSR